MAEVESRLAALEGERSAAAAALGSAARRVRDLQEESAALRTRAHHHHAHALQLQASLADAQVPSHILTPTFSTNKSLHQ